MVCSRRMKGLYKSLACTIALSLFATDADAQSGRLEPGQGPTAVLVAADARATKDLLAALGTHETPLSAPLGLTLFALAGSRAHVRRGKASADAAAICRQLRKRQWQDGSFFDAAPKGPRVRPQVQAMATLGLVEFAVVGTDEDREAARRAVGRVARNVRGDGSCPAGYDANGEADFDATAWSAIALGLADLAGIGTDDAPLAKMCEWLRSQAELLQVDDAPTPRRLSGRARVAAMLFAHYCCGVDPQKHEALEAMLVELAEQQPHRDDSAAFFFVNAALHQRGGPNRQRVRQCLLPVGEAAQQGKRLGTSVTSRALHAAALQTCWRYGNLLSRR